MPGYDFLPHLVTIMGLYMLLYLLHRANEIIQNPKKVTFVLEIISQEKNSVHQLAVASFRENNRLTPRAVENYIDRQTAMPSWQAAILANDMDEIVNLFNQEIQLG